MRPLLISVPLIMCVVTGRLVAQTISENSTVETTQSATPARSAVPSTGASAGETAGGTGPTTLGRVPDGNRAGPVRRASATHVSKGPGVLPNDNGQVWREYDISPYTSRVTNTERPEQAVVDWILRETGTELWFSAPLGLLSADRDTVCVYHTPQIQKMVSAVIDRFLNSKGQSHVFGLRLVTVGSPNWRAKMLPLLRRVSVQTAGTEAWLLAKEDAAVLLNELRRRNDYREHNAPNMVLFNGQQEIIARTQPQKYVKSVNLRPELGAGYQMELGEVESGFTLQLAPLLSVDGQTVDAVVKAQVNQLEKLESISINLPTVNNVQQRVEIQIPRMSGWRLHERFRWPVDKVLLVSRGVVATPSAGTPTSFRFKNPLNQTPPRADALLFLESKGGVNTAGTPASGALPAAGILNRSLR